MAVRNQQIYQEASDWFVRMRDGDDTPENAAALMEWLRASPEHVSAYLDVAALWMEAPHVAVDSARSIEERIVEARADNTVTEVVPRTRRPLPSFTLRRGPVSIAAGLILAVALGLLLWTSGGRTYSTGVGEQRSVLLSDGSTVHLNSASQVRIHLDEHSRQIDLRRGQALFDVAKDPSRPFMVRVGLTSVRAVGTVFDVYRKQSGAVVTVVEGAVDVRDNSLRDDSAAGAHSVTGPGESAPESSGTLRLTAGTQLRLGQQSVDRLHTVDVAAVTAWVQRRLIFEFTPLAEVAEEFNRYNQRPLLIEGEALRAYKISAVFRSTDSAALVRYLGSLPGIQVRETDDTTLITAAP